VREPEYQSQVAAAAAAGDIPPAPALVSLTGFASGAMDRSYRSSASFVGWLLREKGAAPLMRAYAWASVAREYGAGLDALDAQWRSFLAHDVPRTRRSDASGRERFDPRTRPALHAKPCARLQADEPESASERAALLAREGFAEAAADAWCEAAVAGGDSADLHAAALQQVRAHRADLALPLVERALDRVGDAALRREQLLRLRARLLGALGSWDAASEAYARWGASGLAAFDDDVALESSILARDDLRDRYLQAALATAPEDAQLAAGLLASDPAWPPAMSLMLSRGRPGIADSPVRLELVRAFAAASPGPLAARYLLDVAEGFESRAEWDSTAELCRLALAQPRLAFDQRLEGEDLLGRAEWASRVRVVRG
jgi:hypothetical protein